MGILGAILLFVAFSIFNALDGDFHGISIIAKVMFGMGIFFIFGFFVLFYLEMKIHQYYWGQELC